MLSIDKAKVVFSF